MKRPVRKELLYILADIAGAIVTGHFPGGSIFLFGFAFLCGGTACLIKYISEPGSNSANGAGGLILLAIGIYSWILMIRRMRKHSEEE
jgi:hypothetical protein